jgi:O-Antigen ligase
MRRCGLAAATSLVVLGPTVLAFMAGGYFAGPRGWAGACAWACVVVAVLAGARLPGGRAVLLAVGGLGLLAAWTLLSILWAPVAGSAYAAGQIVVLYLGALIAAAVLMDGRAGEWVEPVLAAGALIVIGYGLAGRLLPGVLHYAHSVSAEGRLEQPLTYWNAMGELAAMGFVLCARLAGDEHRPRWLRTTTAAAAAPLGLGLWISFSRGALFACVAGLITLVVVAPCAAQLWALARAVAFGALATVAGAPFAGVASLSGSQSTREHQGLIVLVLLVLITLAAAAVAHARAPREDDRPIALPKRAPALAVALIVAGLALAIAVGAHESGGRTVLAGGAGRLSTLQSNRYAYWSVALRAFSHDPVQGVGAGGWSVDWLRFRHVHEGVQDAHSLPLQTLAELGVVGLALLLAFAGGVALAACRALRVSSMAVGPTAALVVYVAHAPLDWDWQMPAVTLVAVVLMGRLLALSEPATAPRRSAALRARTPTRPAGTLPR